MAGHSRHTLARQNAPSHNSQGHGSTSYRSTAGHVNGHVHGHVHGHSTYESKVAQEVAYSNQHNHPGEQYPQQLDFEAYDSRPPKKEYDTQSQQLYYDETSRSWTYSNPEVHKAIDAPALDYSHNTYPAYPHQANPERSNSAFAEKRRPDKHKLRVFNSLTPSIDNIDIWKEQGQRAGPWNDVGYVSQRSNHECNN